MRSLARRRRSEGPGRERPARQGQERCPAAGRRPRRAPEPPNPASAGPPGAAECGRAGCGARSREGIVISAEPLPGPIPLAIPDCVRNGGGVRLCLSIRASACPVRSDANRFPFEPTNLAATGDGTESSDTSERGHEQIRSRGERGPFCETGRRESNRSAAKRTGSLRRTLMYDGKVHYVRRRSRLAEIGRPSAKSGDREKIT